ncbi:MAG: dihydrolipoyl dehydrogenase, partial [Rhizobacter sp.]|nr:dihydrolipoyl dehydrogenase [Rhizobacter sp.]
VRNVPLAIAFTSPQFASIGQRPDTLDAASTAVGRVSFVNQGRSRVMAANVGAGHVYGCTRTGRLLGAQLIGPAVEHLAHLLAWALQQGLTVDAVLELPFYHPTVEEGLRTAMRELRDAIRKAADKTAPPTAQLLDCGPCP